VALAVVQKEKPRRYARGKYKGGSSPPTLPASRVGIRTRPEKKGALAVRSVQGSQFDRQTGQSAAKE
jgi:hypothetical protein